MHPNWLKGNPLIADKVTPELGAKVVKLVADDMARAKREAEEEKERKDKGGKKSRAKR